MKNIVVRCQILFASRLPTSLKPTSNQQPDSLQRRVLIYMRKYNEKVEKLFKKLTKMVAKSSQIGSKIEEIGARGYPKEATRSENNKKCGGV